MCARCWQTVFVRTNKNSIYRSADEGKSWEKQNWKMEGSQTEEDGKTGVLSMHVSPIDTNKARRDPPHSPCDAARPRVPR